MSLHSIIFTPVIFGHVLSNQVEFLLLKRFYSQLGSYNPNTIHLIFTPLAGLYKLVTIALRITVSKGVAMGKRKKRVVQRNQ